MCPTLRSANGQLINSYSYFFISSFALIIATKVVLNRYYLMYLLHVTFGYFIGWLKLRKKGLKTEKWMEKMMTIVGIARHCQFAGWRHNRTLYGFYRTLRSTKYAVQRRCSNRWKNAAPRMKTDLKRFFNTKVVYLNLPYTPVKCGYNDCH